jgi:CheY-like chemotaxis protein
MPLPHESDKTGHKVEKSDSSISSVASNLWQEAYENPGKTALVVGGAAAAIGMAYAARGQIGKFLPNHREGILLVEDSPFMGKAFRQVLQEQGESVTCFTNITRLQPFTGITNEGAEVVVKPHRFKMAFVDGELVGSNPQGEHVVDALKAARLKSFGISTIPEINESMIRHGAVAAAQKPAALTALVDHSLDLSKITRAPGQVQLEMNSLTARMLSPEMTPVRKKADAILMKYLTE